MRAWLSPHLSPFFLSQHCFHSHQSTETALTSVTGHIRSTTGRQGLTPSKPSRPAQMILIDGGHLDGLCEIQTFPSRRYGDSISLTTLSCSTGQPFYNDLLPPNMRMRQVFLLSVNLRPGGGHFDHTNWFFENSRKTAGLRAAVFLHTFSITNFAPF